MTIDELQHAGQHAGRHARELSKELDEDWAVIYWQERSAHYYRKARQLMGIEE